MTPEEEAFIDWIEFAKDYRMTSDIQPECFEQYERLIEKRREETNGKETMQYM